MGLEQSHTSELVETLVIPEDSLPGRVLGVISNVLIERHARKIRRHLEGDVHVGSMAADARLVPGANTIDGQQAIHAAVDLALDRARASMAARV